jgi:hypothetical protein
LTHFTTPRNMSFELQELLFAMASTTPPQALTEQASRLLKEINRESTDGYTLMSRIGMRDEVEFQKLVKELLGHSVIAIRGDEDRIGEAYFYVPLEAQGRVNYCLERFGSRRASW